MAVRLLALYAGRPLPPGRSLVLISVRGCVDPRAIVRLEGLAQFEKYNDLIGNRNHDPPACSVVPQLMLPRSPIRHEALIYFEQGGTFEIGTKTVQFAAYDSVVGFCMYVQYMQPSTHLFIIVHYALQPTVRVVTPGCSQHNAQRIWP
jgi:hypothetical protein